MSSSLCDPGSEILAAEQQESTNFTNDDLNYETETLKVNVEQRIQDIPNTGWLMCRRSAQNS